MENETLKVPPGPILRDLDSAAARLGIDAKRLKRAAERLDIAVVLLDGQMFFREESLQAWAERYERRAW
jgi:hypothetical protein